MMCSSASQTAECRPFLTFLLSQDWGLDLGGFRNEKCDHSYRILVASKLRTHAICNAKSIEKLCDVPQVSENTTEARD